MMEKSYYIITCKPGYLELFRMQSARPGRDFPAAEADEADVLPQRMILAITQGGFGQDVIDDERQAKERFLEYLFDANGIDLPRSEEAFDKYFDLEPVDEFIEVSSK